MKFVGKLKNYYTTKKTNLISSDNKKKSTLHTTLKKTNFVQNIKGSCSPCPTFGEENTFHQCLIMWGKILQTTILDA
jgi:hypothetical protein